MQAPRDIHEGAEVTPTSSRPRETPIGPLRHNELDPAELHRVDLELVQAILGSDESAIPRFAHRMKCVARILSAQNRRIGRPLNEHDLADLSQDVLVIAWKRMGTYKGASSLESWIFRICFLVIMNKVRKTRGRGEIMKELEKVPEPAARAPGPDAWEFEDLYRSLDELPDEEETVIRLKHFEGFTFEAIGERLGISPNTAKTRYYRGRHNLRLLMTRQSGEDTQ